MVLPTGDQLHPLEQAGQRVAVEAHHHNVDDDPPLNPILPIEEVKVLTVHQLEDFLGRQDCGGHDEEHPDHDGGPGYPALLLVRHKTVTTHRLAAMVFYPGDVLELRVGTVATVVPNDALVGVDQDDEGGVEHGEDQVEGQADEEKLSDFEPLEVEETLAERVFEEMIVSGLYEGHEHCALTPTLVWNQHFVIYKHNPVSFIIVKF